MTLQPARFFFYSGSSQDALRNHWNVALWLRFTGWTKFDSEYGRTQNISLQRWQTRSLDEFPGQTFRKFCLVASAEGAEGPKHSTHHIAHDTQDENAAGDAATCRWTYSHSITKGVILWYTVVLIVSRSCQWWLVTLLYHQSVGESVDDFRFLWKRLVVRRVEPTHIRLTHMHTRHTVKLRTTTVEYCKFSDSWCQNDVTSFQLTGLFNFSE